MAKTIKEIEQEFNAASLETRNTFEKLKKWDTLPTDYIKKNQDKYDEIQAEYKAAQEKKNALSKELKQAKAEKEATIKGTASENVYTKALSNLAKAEVKINGYNGKEKYIEAYKIAEQAFNDVVAAGKKPRMDLPTPQIEIPAETQQNLKPDGSPAGEPTYSEFINTIADPKNVEQLKAVQEDLKKNFGYKGAADGKWSKAFQQKLQDVYTERGAFPKALQGTSFREYLVKPTVAGAGGTGGSGKPNQWGTISNPTQAKSVINNVAASVLGREATSKEIASITKKLVAAQKANPYRQDANGMTVGGVDAQQFVTDIFQAGEEYASKKQAKQDLVQQSIQETLNANGIPYKPGQLKIYADRVKNGEDIKAIEAEIRNVASLGQPDSIKKLMAAGTDLETIYAPYKRTMAASLGINPDTITLDDPTLRMAIGPDKEMSLYDYKKAIRQDNRWKYSEEANNEVTNMINQVKRDFGFMG